MREEKTVSRKNLTFYKGFSILDGKLFSGVCVDYYDNRRKKYEGKFKNGKEEGLCIHWYENGQKESEGHYRDGKEEGLWSYWDENGLKKDKDNFKNGVREGSIRMETHSYENGPKELEDRYENEDEFVRTEWYENGQKEYEKHYKDGTLNGLSIEW